MSGPGAAAAPPGPGGRLEAAAVVAAEAVAVLVVLAVQVDVELRSVLDLLLRAVHEDRLGVEIDAVDDAGRQQDLLAEDPRPGVDDQLAPADFVRRLVDLADAAIHCLNGEADEAGGIDGLLAERPDIGCRARAIHL